MKNITNKILFLSIVLLIISCKKENKNNTDEFTYTDDNITTTQIIDNFSAITEGAYSMSNSGLTGTANEELNTTDFKYLRTSNIVINGRKFSAQKYYYYQYYIPSYPDYSDQEAIEIQTFFTSVNAGSKTNFQLIDTNENKIITFIVNNPKPLNMSIENNKYYEAPTGSRILLKWNPDPTNKLGIAVVLATDKGIRYLQFDDITGSIDITDEILSDKTTNLDRTVVTITRGVILVGIGKDERRYKFTNRIGGSETVYF